MDLIVPSFSENHASFCDDLFALDYGSSASSAFSVHENFFPEEFELTLATTTTMMMRPLAPFVCAPLVREEKEGKKEERNKQKQKQQEENKLNSAPQPQEPQDQPTPVLQPSSITTAEEAKAGTKRRIVVVESISASSGLACSPNAVRSREQTPTAHNDDAKRARATPSPELPPCITLQPAPVPRKRTSGSSSKKQSASSASGSGGRGQYLCTKCGVLKKGHKCAVQEVVLSPEILRLAIEGACDIVIPYAQLAKFVNK